MHMSTKTILKRYFSFYEYSQTFENSGTKKTMFCQNAYLTIIGMSYQSKKNDHL